MLHPARRRKSMGMSGWPNPLPQPGSCLSAATHTTVMSPAAVGARGAVARQPASICERTHWIGRCVGDGSGTSRKSGLGSAGVELRSERSDMAGPPPGGDEPTQTVLLTGPPRDRYCQDGAREDLIAVTRVTAIAPPQLA